MTLRNYYIDPSKQQVGYLRIFRCLIDNKYSIFKMNIEVPHSMKLIFSLVVFITTTGCKSDPPTDLSKDVIIPKPVSVKATGETFRLNDEAIIYVGNPELQSAGEYIAASLKESNDLSLPVKAATQNPEEGAIHLALTDDQDLGEEGYVLEITEEFVKLSGPTPAGVFRGLQTLRQLILANESAKLTLSTGTIRDYPAYTFRGSMLDVARHFFSVDDVKRYIDLIALYKMNIMHLHLSDDQGWRIEIKSWPNLTAIGSKGEVGEGAGGYYTQDQFKELVQYAKERYITIIPEVDFPGHTNAALASYPELNCSGKAPAFYKGVEVGFSTLCASKEITFKFIDDVVRELAEMTPGPFIHLGGDESHATKKEDYILFANRMQQIVESRGKKMIGWEEISQGKLTPGTVVQYWSKAHHAIEAVKQGAMIIMSPATNTYLDMKYDTTSKLGQAWAAYIEVDSSYNWALSSKVKEIPRKNILGIEAPLWTETITNMDEIEYMIFPRLPGLAELGWSPEESRSWEEYKNRLGRHGEVMEKLDIDFYPSKQISW
jgi:hexosaminidase